MIQGTQGQDEVIQPRAKKLPIKWIAIGVGTIAVFWTLKPAFSQWVEGAPKIDVERITTAKVHRGTLIRDIAVTGKLVAANAPQLFAPEQGAITLLAKQGETVSAGQVVAKLESPELDALVMQETSTLDKLKIEASRGELADKESQLELERSLDTARVKLNAAKREMERAQLSYEKQIMSEIDYAKSKDMLLEAELFFAHAEKRVALAKERLTFENQNRNFAVQRQQILLEELTRRQSNLDILSPVNGVVGNWLVAQKDTIAKSTPLMTIVDLSEYEAELSVPEFYADDIGLGLSVAMTINGAPLTGQIIAISPEIKNSQVTVRVSVAGNDDLKLRQNQRLNARIEFEKKENVLMVKKGPFVKSTGGTSAFVMSGDDQATRQTIATGSLSVDFVELIEGAKEGDTFIISSYEEFNDTDVIRIRL